MPSFSKYNPHRKQAQSPDRTYPSYVYFIADGTDHVKVGISEKPRERLADLQIAHHRKLEIIATIGCVDTNAARQVERRFHLYYHKVRESGEWFHITTREVREHIALLKTFAVSVVINDEPSYILNAKLKTALACIEAELSSNKPLHEAAIAALRIASYALEETGELVEHTQEASA